MAYQILMIALLVFGFGFVIFWHELGHFLAARWAGVRVEQFAVGMGQAIFSFRKGIGLKLGATRAEYERRTGDWLQTQQVKPKGVDSDYTEYQREQAGKAIGLGQTEYRLSWIPLGGYVKPTGQDDLRPNGQVQEEDPHSYNAASVGKRMVIISAGVIMNIILAAFMFMGLFLIGYDVPPAVVGGVVPGSPAQIAGLEAGDRILYFDGTFQHDFNKVRLNAALARDGAPVEMLVRRLDGTEEKLTIVPARADDDPHSFVQMGILPPTALEGLKNADFGTEEDRLAELTSPAFLQIRPGDVVTHVNGVAVGVREAWKLDQALQASGGEPIDLMVVNDAQGVARTIKMQPRFVPGFKRQSIDFAGLMPRVEISSVQPNSSARGKILPGDVVLRVVNKDAKVDELPSADSFVNLLRSAGDRGQTIDMTVLRNGEVITQLGLVPNIKVGEGKLGLGVGPTIDEDHAVVAGINPSSAAAGAGIPAGSTIVAINGENVASWHDVQRILLTLPVDSTAKIDAMLADGSPQSFDMKLGVSDLQKLQRHRYMATALFAELIDPRKTTNPITAARWGVGETRDFILQFYLTLQRMVSGDVSYKNMMGPVGIVYAGSKFAFKGIDWLIWFLAMISANLAVVNFLPIPIVDGGQFMFLIIEKIMGKPLSPKAQAVAQYVGLAMLLSVFLLVTYQDIARFF